MNKKLKLTANIAESYLVETAGLEYVLILKERIPNKHDQVYELIREAHDTAMNRNNHKYIKLFEEALCY
jgi:hypothetical protein